MDDLFGRPVLPGLRLTSDIVTSIERAMLLDRLNRTGPTAFRFQGGLDKRLTTSFGIPLDMVLQSQAAFIPRLEAALAERRNGT